MGHLLFQFVHYFGYEFNYANNTIRYIFIPSPPVAVVLLLLLLLLLLLMILLLIIIIIMILLLLVFMMYLRVVVLLQCSSSADEYVLRTFSCSKRVAFVGDKHARTCTSACTSACTHVLVIYVLAVFCCSLVCSVREEGELLMKRSIRRGMNPMRLSAGSPLVRRKPRLNPAPRAAAAAAAAALSYISEVLLV